MALSNQYYQETGGNQQAAEHQQDPTKRFTQIDTAVREVRAESINAYEKNPA